MSFMNGLKQARIILYTADMAKAVAYYRDTLGLPIVWPEVDDYSGEFWVTLDAAGTSVALHSGREEPVGKSAPEVSFTVADLDEVLAEVKSRGAEFGEVIEPHPGVIFCSGYDPDGHRVVLQQG